MWPRIRPGRVSGTTAQACRPRYPEPSADARHRVAADGPQARCVLPEVGRQHHSPHLRPTEVSHRARIEPVGYILLELPPVRPYSARNGGLAAVRLVSAAGRDVGNLAPLDVVLDEVAGYWTTSDDGLSSLHVSAIIEM